MWPESFEIVLGGRIDRVMDHSELLCVDQSIHFISLDKFQIRIASL